MFSYLKNIPIVYTNLSAPKMFDRFELGQDLSLFSYENRAQKIITPKTEIMVGAQKLPLWEKLYFHVSLAGLCISPFELSSIRVKDSILKGFTDNARMVACEFEELIIFDDAGVYGIGDPITQLDKKKMVYDWFSVRSGMKHRYDVIESDSEFVSKIIFYRSSRIDGDHDFKDAVAVSNLTDKQLIEYEFSDVNSRFKSTYMMKKAGIRGARNGRDMRNKEKYKYYAVKIENTKREIESVRNYYNPTENIIFNYDSVYDIISHTHPKQTYATKLIRRIY